MKIGFVGLGNMGLPMAVNLCKAGFEVFGKNRSAGKEQDFVNQGGQIGVSLAKLAAEMDVIITCLPLPADVEEVYTGSGGLLAHASKKLILIDCSTVSPDLSRELYAKAEKAGVQFLDAPVSGGTTGAAAGTLSVMVGGKEAVYAKVLKVLKAFGKNIHYTGESGSGSAVKLINQLMVGIHSQATSEAYSLGKQAGLDLDLLFEILNSSFAQSKIMERHYSQYISRDAFDPGFALKLLAKDMNLVAEMAASAGVKLSAGNRIQALINQAIKQGYGDLDMAGLYRYQLAVDEQGRNMEPKKHFAVFLPMLDADKSVKFRTEHLQFLDECRAAGKLMANGRFVDGAGGLVIYMASSFEEVERWVKQDPYIINQARRYEIHEWDIVLADSRG